MVARYDPAGTSIGCFALSASDVPIHDGGTRVDSCIALQEIGIRPIAPALASQILVRHHYLHTFPAGTQLCFGAFRQDRLLGAVTMGAGPFLAFQLVEGAAPDDCLTLTRMWLSDELPRNSESRVLGLTVRSLRRHTKLKFLVSYSDPCIGHVGTIYQATNWLYIGLSEPMPAYDLGDGKVRHSRSLAHAYGTHSVPFLESRGMTVRVVHRTGKHRYVYFIERAWHCRLRAPVLPYPKKEHL